MPNEEGKYVFTDMERALPKIRNGRKGSSASQEKEDNRRPKPALQQTGARRPQDLSNNRTPVFTPIDLAVSKTEHFIDSMKTLPSCLECSKPVFEDEGYEIPAMNGYFHDNCFRCCACRQVFADDRPYIVHKGRAYCERDYRALNAAVKKCEFCTKDITDGTLVTAFGKSFHERHLRCRICKNPTKGIHVEHEGRVYCKKDMRNIPKPRCKTCKSMIDFENPSRGKEALLAHGKLYHKSCLVCTDCKKPFPNQKFVLHKNRPYCEKDYFKLTNSICAKCTKPIQGRCVDVQETNEKYHFNCWCCAHCDESLSNEYFSYRGKNYCATDIDIVYSGHSSSGTSSVPKHRQTMITNL